MASSHGSSRASSMDVNGSPGSDSSSLLCTNTCNENRSFSAKCGFWHQPFRVSQPFRDASHDGQSAAPPPIILTCRWLAAGSTVVITRGDRGEGGRRDAVGLSGMTRRIYIDSALVPDTMRCKRQWVGALPFAASSYTHAVLLYYHTVNLATCRSAPPRSRWAFQQTRQSSERDCTCLARRT